jgi:ribosomal protein S18 acetylase RimI-like enzyme
MARKLTNKDEIRTLLNRERDWSLYALADLDDGLFQHCDWWGVEGGLALVYRGIANRPIFVLGDAATTQELLQALPERTGSLHLKPDQLRGAEGIYEYRERQEVLRMMLEDFRPRAGEAEKLGPEARGEIEELYGDGASAMIPAPWQLETGLYRGIRRGGRLAAVAGVRASSRTEGVAAVGGVFTRADCRGKGLAQAVTSAVAAALREAGIESIGLTVAAGNGAAIRAYERIGFRRRMEYFEGRAERVGATDGKPTAPSRSRL